MYHYRAKIIRWLDGDTVEAEIDLGFHCSRREKLRLARIDAAELRSPGVREQRRARSARWQAKRLAPVGSLVEIRTQRPLRQDRYARYLAEVFTRDGLNLSDELLKLPGVRKY